MTMREFRLERAGQVPVILLGTRLTPPNEYFDDSRSTRFSTGIELFQTASGEYVLYIGTTGRQNTFQHVNQVLRHADKRTSTAIIDYCGGYLDAKLILELLGKATEERIE
jgi:hypothetical protein